VAGSNGNPAGVVSASSTVNTIGSGFSSPTGVAVDASGDVFVADPGHNAVKEIVAGSNGNPAGVVSSSSTVNIVGSGFSLPHGVAVDGIGNVFVADPNNNAVYEIVAVSGVVSTSSAVNTIGSGFTGPYGVWVDGIGDVFVADDGNNAVKEIVASDGVVSSSSTVNTLSTGGSPNDVAVDGSGNVFVADITGSTINEIVAGTQKFPTTAVGSTSVALTLYFTFDSGGTLASTPYVVLTQGKQGIDFQAAKTQGTNACVTGTSYAAGDVCTVAVTFTPTKPYLRVGAVQLMSSTGLPIATFQVHGTGNGPQVAFPPGVQTMIGSGFGNPSGVAVDGSGDVFVADYGNNAVCEIVAASGAVSSSSTVNTVGSGFNFPYGVAVDGSGNVFVADGVSSTVYEIVAVKGVVSSTSTVNTVGSGFGYPTGMAIDGSGNVFVADDGNNTVYEIVAVNGVVSSSSTVNTVGSGFSQPNGVAVDGSGNVFVGDYGNNAVKEIVASNGLVTASSTVTTVGSGFFQPVGVAVDGSGDVFVADTGNNAVKEILAVNGLVSSSSTVNTVGSGLSFPTGVAVDASGNIFVANTANTAVNEIAVSNPPSLSFADTEVGSTSSDSPQTVTLVNIGNEALSFPVLSSGNNPSISPNFTLNSGSGDNCPLIASGGTAGSLAVQSSCTLPINFTPTAGSSISGSLILTDTNLNANPGTPQTISLAGTGVDITLSPTSLPNAVYGTAYSQTIVAAGGASPYTYAVTGGALPAGISLNPSTGVLAGTPSATGNFSFTVTATDTISFSGSQAYTLTVNAPTISLSPTTLPTATVAVAYNTTLSAGGGASPYSYVVTSGALPGGVTMSSAGALSGTPTAGGTFNFTVTAKDTDNFTGSQVYTLTVSAPTLTLSPASGTTITWTIETGFSQTFTAGGGTSPYTYALTVNAGTLPTGLSMNASTGVLSGTATSSGTINFTIRATDSSSGTGAPFSVSGTYTLTIGTSTITVTPTTLSPATVGVAYITALSSSGGVSPYTYTVTSGALPAGIILSNTGVVTGTPTAAGIFSFTVTAKDTDNSTGSQTYTLPVNVPALALSPAAGSTFTGTAETAFSQTFTAGGGTAPYTYALTVNSGSLPTGITMNTATGALSGTPTSSGAVNFTIRATDSSTGTGEPFSVSGTYTLTVGMPTITVSPTTLANAAFGTAYSQTITAAGGRAAYTYAISAGALPAGITLSSAGALTGSPTASGSFSFTVTATDSDNFTGRRAYILSVTAPTITISTETLPAATVGAIYSTTISASGGTSPYTYTISAGSLPAGIGLSSTGVLTGTPTVGGTFSFTVTATDSSTSPGPYQGTATYTLTVNPATATLSFTTIPAETYGNAPFTVTASSASTGTIAYSVVSGPATIKASTGLVTLTGAGTVTLKASQAATSSYSSATAETTINVAEQPSSTVVSTGATAIAPNQSVTLTAAVSATTAGTAAMPTGTVTFLDNGTALSGAVNLVNGVATLVMPSLPPATTAVITAVYSGDANFLGSTSSNSASLVVAALQGFTFTDTGASAYSAVPGATAAYSFALAPLSGSYPGAVTFTVTGLPMSATASFTPSTVAANAGPASIAMTVQTAAATAHNSSPFGRGVVLALLLLPLGIKRSIRKKLNGWTLPLLLLVVGTTVTMSGCGSRNGFFLESPQSYTLTVTATSGTLTENQTVTLIVQ
jgi:DNA-binding beta-propeller fold protein YncE